MTKVHYERVTPKLTKAEVEYTNDHGDSGEQCAKCAHYLTATTCAIVAGRINPDGWCNQFEGRDHESVEDTNGGGISYKQPPLKGVAPRNAFRMPHDVMQKLGDGDLGVGHAVLSETVGQHPMSTPIGTVHPEAVQNIGNGDLAAGHRVLRKFVTALRHRGEP